MFSLLGYIGPETIMPIASAIAAAVGAVLFMGQSVLRFSLGLFQRLLGKREDATGIDGN